MKIKALLCCLFFLVLSSISKAQAKCGFDVKMQELRAVNPAFEKEINNSVREYISQQKGRLERTNNTQTINYYIPVVVHVINTGGAIGTIYNPSDANITSAINYLNSVYDGTWTGAGGSILGVGDVQIKFVLATKDPNNNVSTGINRVDGSSVPGYTASGLYLQSAGAAEATVKNLSRWDPTRYYNVWVVNKIDGLDGTVGAFIAGYAYFPMPNNSAAASLQVDGIVMLATQMNAGEKTLPHEIGHAFNLYHPFEGETIINGSLNTCPANGIPSSDGDACTDTDPVINPADDGYGGTAFSCRTGINSCSGTAYNDNTEKNFMNYTNCYQLFTGDQKTRMLAAATNSTRSALATSWANNQGTYPTTWSAPAPPAAATPVSTLNNANALGIMYVSLNGNIIYSLNATQDGGYLDNVKWYNLFAVQPSTAYTMQVGLRNSTNNEQVGLWIDYDGNGSFNNTNERAFYTSNNPAANSIIINFTTPATLSGNIVRMRIMNDYSTIYGMPGLIGNMVSLYDGQAEDYPVFLRSTATLPLTLTQFSGYTSNHNNYLTWNTVQEVNTKEFGVQRSWNGSDYTTIGTVAAKGNSSAESVYHFTEPVANGGSYIYRLKIVDINGTFSYSKIVNLNVTLPSKTMITTNPFTDKIRLILPDHTGPATIRLHDALGRTVWQQSIAAGQPNSIEVAVDPSMSKGIYMLETITNNGRFTDKLIKE